MDSKQLLRCLPAVDRLLGSSALRELAPHIPAPLLSEAARETVEGLRRRILAGEALSECELEPEVVAGLAAEVARLRMRPSFTPVVNATGVVLHTNLGRAPLAQEAIEAIAQTAAGYCNLELDLSTGRRGERFSHVESLLCRLSGAEAALVVNNNAGAVLLALTALAKGREAVVSRGELVEIGGSFRIPEVMEAGGVRLREVGATNRTRLKDYRQAIGEQTALLLKVHPSNYRILGFTEAVSSEELAELGRECGLPVMEDLGSGMLMDLSAFGLPKEPTVQEAVKAGIDVISFSGDKLLGGPQAGILLGRRDRIERIKRHPMARALRIDKLSLAALEATLRLYLDEKTAVSRIPTLRMLAAESKDLRRRCQSLRRRILALDSGIRADIQEAGGQVGGGALPAFELPGPVLAIRVPDLGARQLSEKLRSRRPALMGRIQEDCLLLDLRCVAKAEEGDLLAALAAAISGGAPS